MEYPRRGLVKYKKMKIVDIIEIIYFTYFNGTQEFLCIIYGNF